MGGSVNESLSVTDRDGQESFAVPSESKELWHHNECPIALLLFGCHWILRSVFEVSLCRVMLPALGAGDYTVSRFGNEIPIFNI